MKTLKLKFLGKNLNLLLEESEYTETGNKYLGLYEKNSQADKINGVWLVKGTLEYIQGYIYGAFGYNDRN